MSLGTTIFAVSSGSGRAGIAVVRVSGPASHSVVKSLCGIVPDPRRAVVRELRHPVTRDVLDVGLVLLFKGPQSVTGEDVAELHLHGGVAVVNSVLGAISGLPGLVPAEPGEFTRRAFRNGKLDLVEAEGLADLLSAEGEVQRRQALFHMGGAASEALGLWLDETMAILARLEAAIDFVDEADVAQSALDGVRPRIVALVQSMGVELERSTRADAVRDGVRIVIVGAPNVGKSSLLNALAERDAAIVSPIAGTTRDAIEVKLMVAGLPVTIADTAGLRSESSDAIEVIGMKRAIEAARRAHLVLYVIASDVEGEAVTLPEFASVLRVLNKCDLPGSELIHVRNNYDLRVSTLTGEGMEALMKAIHDHVSSEYARHESPIIVRERHRAAVVNSIRLLNDSLTAEADRIELAAEAVRGAAHSLSRLSGRVDVEDLLGRIFSEFCVGK